MSGDVVYDVVVIGAGVSGLACAHRLLKDNDKLSVLVLEARDRLGGRILTSGSVGSIESVDLGAQWIHGSGKNAITDLATELGLTLVKTDHESHVIYDMRSAKENDDGVLSGGVPLPAGMLQTASEEFWESVIGDQLREVRSHTKTDKPLEGGLKKAFELAESAGQLDALKDKGLQELMVLTHFDLDYASPVSETSMLWFDVDDELIGDDLVIVEGFHKIIEHLAVGVKVKLSHIVSEIEYEGTEWAQVHCTNGSCFRSKHVVVTIPLGVLQANSVSFLPALPTSFNESLRGSSMGLLNKSILLFSDRFWDGYETFTFLNGDTRPRGCFPWFYDASYLGTTPVLVVLYAAEFAEEAESWSDGKLSDRIMVQLRGMFPGAPDPVTAYHTRWGQDPFSRGSYSFRKLGFEGPSAGFDNIRGPFGSESRLRFAGEHTNKESFAMVQGAYVSGLRAAAEILEDFSF